MEVGLPHRGHDTAGGHDYQIQTDGEPERPRETYAHRSRDLDRGAPQQQRRASAAVARHPLYDAVAADAGQGHQCGDDSGNGNGVAVAEQIEEVGLPGVEPPGHEDRLYGRGENQQTQ